MTVVIYAAAASLAALLLWYVLAGRAWLKTQPWAKGFFAAIEPIELALFKKSETILVGRLLWLGGGLVTAYDAVVTFGGNLIGVDWTPVTARLLAGVPDDMRGFVVTMGITMIGLLINWLRKRTTKPVDLVAVADKDLTPGVAAALSRAESAKLNAIAAVADTKAD